MANPDWPVFHIDDLEYAMRKAMFSLGQIVQHRKFDYRGVVFDVDFEFHGTDEWYEQVARSRPPKDKPWYRVLVDNGGHETYVAERHLEPAETSEPVNHEFVPIFFQGLKNGVYVPKARSN